MKDNLKRLVAEMERKAEFVEIIANNYGLSYIYVMQNWFQSRWNIPKDKIEEVLKIAQNYLFQQTERKREILNDTGFINNIKVTFEEVKEKK